MCLLLPDSRFGVRQHCHLINNNNIIIYIFIFIIVLNCSLSLTTTDASLMANPFPQSTKRNPNWGGRREGSGRKKNTPISESMALPSTSPASTPTQTDTTQTRNLPVNMSTSARGFFTPRNGCNRFQDLSTTLHLSPSNTTDQGQGATNQTNGV